MFDPLCIATIGAKGTKKTVTLAPSSPAAGQPVESPFLLRDVLEQKPYSRP